MTGSNPVEGRDGAGKWMVFPFKEDKQLELI
jgi:hypothetical protein